MSLRSYWLRLLVALWVYITLFAPSSRAHLGLPEYLPFYAARGLLFALPVSSALLLFAGAKREERRFPDALTGAAFTVVAGLLYVFSISSGHATVNMQLIAIPAFAAATLWLAHKGRRKGMA
jgi:peptidoglycan/LPS O-acetylase OafA/YrhL